MSLDNDLMVRLTVQDACNFTKQCPDPLSPVGNFNVKQFLDR